MRYIKPHYYEEFRCLAGDCPATCCAGWQIMIDEDTLERYERKEGAFGKRLERSIDWEEGCFHQYDGRCAFLNAEDLCDIYKEMGPDALCTTCRMYPRHVEEYEGLRELSLSLSCPEAARLILTCREPVRFLETVTEEEDEEFDDMDILLFTQLEETRELLFEIVQERRINPAKRKAMMLDVVWRIQECLDDGEYFKVDEIIKEYKKKLKSFDTEEKQERKGFLQKREEFQIFRRLEILRNDWKSLLDRAEQELFSQGEEHYEIIEQAFEGWLSVPDKEEKMDKRDWEIIEEQLLIFFLYTYFCGAVYDNYIYAKAALAVFSADWIREFCILSWLDNGGHLKMEDVIRIAYRYAREVEHSDDNLETVIQELDAQSSLLC